MRLLLLLICLSPTLLAAAPRVVTSIVPLHEIVGEIMLGIAQPQLIIANQESTHHFAFRPSHLRRLQQADLVIWVDRNFEAGFGRIDEILPGRIRRLELLPALGLGHEDGHFWYSPTLLQQSIAILAQTLAEIDPENQALYRHNARVLATAVTTWHEHMRLRWRAAGLRFLTEHGFLAQFASDFDGFDIAPIQDYHAAPGGLRDLNRVEQWLRQQPTACLITLESTLSPLARSLAEKYRLGVVKLAAIAVNDNRLSPVVRRLRQLENALESCLEKSRI